MINLSEHLLNIGTDKKPRLYLEVKYRLVWLREQEPDAQITTEMLHLDLEKEVTAEVSEWNNNTGRMEKVVKHAKGLVIFKATVKLPSRAIGTGTKMENAAAFGDFLEKAESGAIGRALASLGFGTQFVGDELAEGTRIVDAPVTRPSYDPDKPSTPSQHQTINKLQRELGQTESDLEGLSFGDCAALLKELGKRVQLAKAS
jgi:hypothetical protein